MVKPPPAPLTGMMASKKTSTPMPPTQWVKLRQKRRPLGSPSTAGRMEAPVVVKPETVSKRASTRFGMAPDKKKGRQPKKLMAIQARLTQTRPSLARKPVSAFRQSQRSRRYTPALMSAERVKPSAADPSPSARQMARGSSRNRASSPRIRPMIRPIMR